MSVSPSLARSAPSIKFGTDGWRAVIADGYTFDNVARVACATGRWLQAGHDDPRVVIGYDARFLGARFAEHAARTFASMGIPVLLADSVVTTPAVSWAAKAYDCAAGIAITASHNPPEYNGFKIKTHHAGPASPEEIAEVEAELARLVDVPGLRSRADLEADGLIETVDLWHDYVDLLRREIDVDAIRAAGLRVAHDAMFGAGKGVVQAVLGDDRVVPLHHDDNPGMHGRAPEPIARNLDELFEAVVREGCDVGLANDGDADRIGLVDETGAFVDSHRILALLVRYLHVEKGLGGNVVKTFSTTDLIDRMAEHYDLPLSTTKIGFKYIAPQIIEGDVLVGGEESGGIAVKGHIPERDGIYIGLLIIEMMVRRGMALSALVDELFEQFGAVHYHREDLHLTPERKAEALERLSDGGLDTVDGRPVESVETLDGFKFRPEGGGWVMVRPSGTEPVLRVYAEADTPDRARSFVQSAVEQL